MSVSNCNILEINMIKEIINTSNRSDKTKKNLIKVLDSIINVADKIIEWEDYIDKNDNIFSSTDDDSDEDFGTILIPSTF